MKTVLEMAREANDYATAALGVDAIPRVWRALRDEKFAALVREDERENRQEPVAWLYERENSITNVHLGCIEDAIDRGWKETPLYLEPSCVRVVIAPAYDGSNVEAKATTPPTAALAARQMRDAAVKVCHDLERKRWETLANGGGIKGWSPKDVTDAIAALPVPGDDK